MQRALAAPAPAFGPDLPRAAPLEVQIPSLCLNFCISPRHAPLLEVQILHGKVILKLLNVAWGQQLFVAPPKSAYCMGISHLHLS